MKKGDLVRITCEHPHGYGAHEYVKNRIGVIFEIKDYLSKDGYPCYIVKDDEGGEYLYAQNELVPAEYELIRHALWRKIMLG